MPANIFKPNLIVIEFPRLILVLKYVFNLNPLRMVFSGVSDTEITIQFLVRKFDFTVIAILAIFTIL